MTWMPFLYCCKPFHGSIFRNSGQVWLDPEPEKYTNDFSWASCLLYLGCTFFTQLFVLRLIRLSIYFMCSQFFPSRKFPFIHIGYLRTEYLEYLVITHICASPEKKLITFSEFGRYKIQSVVKAELPHSHDANQLLAVAIAGPPGFEPLGGSLCVAF
jgi:hypothetical protein